MWPISVDGIRIRLKNRLRNAGFPPEKFGNHSFRSGFLCSALLHAEDSTDVRTAVMESCAMVAGWTTGSKHMKRYAKRCLRRQIVCTRIVGLSAAGNKTKNSIMREDASQSQTIHAFDIKEPVVPTYIFTWAFAKELRKKITWPGASKLMLSELFTLSKRASINYFGRVKQDDTLEQAEPERSTSKPTSLEDRGYAYVRNILKDQPSALPKLVQEAITMLKETGKMASFKRQVKEKYGNLTSGIPDNNNSLSEENTLGDDNEDSQIADASQTEPKPKRKRVEWSPEEDAKLIELVKEGKTRRQIYEQIPTRIQSVIDRRYKLLQKRNKEKGINLPDLVGRKKRSYVSKTGRFMTIEAALSRIPPPETILQDATVPDSDFGDALFLNLQKRPSRDSDFDYEGFGNSEGPSRVESSSSDDDSDSDFKPLEDRRDRVITPLLSNQKDTDSSSLEETRRPRLRVGSGSRLKKLLEEL